MKKLITGQIATISPEAEHIIKIDIQLHRKLSFRPGQYVMLALAGNPDEKRAFSIVSGLKNKITLCIKKNGTFTARLFLCKPGQEVIVFGPYGKFSLPKEKKPLVFIAGGIGITPLYCMLHQAAELNHISYMFYSGRSKNEMGLFDALSRMNASSCKVFFFVTREPCPDCLNTRINAAIIREKVNEFKESRFYLCGPERMMQAIREQLVALNIRENEIWSENF